MKHNNKILKLVAFTLMAILMPHMAALAQGLKATGKPKPSQAIGNTANQTYVLKGIKVSGTQYFDEDLLITVTGLKIGDEIKPEGDEKVTKALLNLWKQNFFSNIDIKIDKIVGDDIFLDIHLVERPRLSKFNFKGIKQNEANDLKDKLPLVKSKVITEATRVNVLETINKFYYEKGYLNTTAKIIEKRDTSLLNSVIMTIIIDKGIKSKINQVNVVGNDNADYLKVKGKMKGSKEMARLSFHPVRDESGNSMAEGTLPEYIKGKGFLSISKTLSYLDPYLRYNFITASKYNKSKFVDDKENLVQYYNSLGYRDAQVVKDSLIKRKDGNLDLAVYVDEGNKYYFGNIVWRGNTKYTDSFLNLLLAIKKGDVYNQELLDKRLGKIPSPDGGDDITSLYMDDGYLYFNVEPQETSIEGDTINFELKITEGQQAIIGNIIINGNDKTREYVLRREIRTLPGRKFSRSDLIRSNREIGALGYFDAEKINIVPKPKPDGTVDIEYTVVEKSNDQLELQAGFGGGLGLTGTLGLGFNNFSTRNIFNKKAYDPLPMGDGQKLNIRGQANGKWFNSLTTSFTEPWFGGKKPTSLQLSFYRTYMSQASQLGTNTDTSGGNMVTIGGSATLVKRLKWPDDNFVLSYGLNYQRYKLNNYTQFSRDLFNTGVADNIFLRLSLSRYTLDQPLYPRSGSNISFTASFTPPFSMLRNTAYDTTAQVRFRWIEYHKYRFTAEWYQKVKGNLIFRFAVKHGYLGNYNPSITTPFERFQVGGNGLQGFTLFGRDIIAQRGYDVYAQDAIIFNKYTAEVRYPFSLNPSSTIYGLAFFDAANAWGSYKNFNPFRLNRDAGVGIRIFLPMFGMLGLDYGMRFDSNISNTIIPNQPFKNTNLTFMLGVEPD
jgi:outer membrane protein insertion porin family